MEAKEKEILIYKNIDFYNRYEKLSNDYSFEGKTFQDYSNDEVIKIIKELGYNVSYNSKESFFGIGEKRENLYFKFNISLKYGLTELIVSARKISPKKYLAGDVFANMAKLMEPYVGRERGVSFRSSFSQL